MANEIENKENELEDENIDIGDIEGLERDSPKEEPSSNIDSTNNNQDNENSNGKENSSNKQEFNAEDSEPLEILKDGKLKTSQREDEKQSETKEKNSLKDKLKESKAIKILLIVLAALIILIIAFISFSSTTKQTEPAKKVVEKAPVLDPIKTYSFKLDHINVSRLNKKLENLTKYELLGLTQEEYLKQQKLEALKAEKQKQELKLRVEQEARERVALELARKQAQELEKEKEQEALKKEQEAKKNEESINSNENEAKQEEVPKLEVKNQEQVQSSIVEKEKNENKFLKFVQISTNKKAIYKSYLKELKELDTRIHACRNINNFIEVFVGPLNKDEDTKALIQAIKKTKPSENIVEIELTKEEFANRCMVF